MTETRCLCDSCKCPDATGFGYNVGSCVDASGNNGSVDLIADLCESCRIKLYGSIIRLFPRNEIIEAHLRKLAFIQEVRD